MKINLLTIILLAESIEFITSEGAHISKMLTIHDYKRRSEGSCNCYTTTRLKKFIVVYKTEGYCTNIYMCRFKRKEPCSDKLTPFLNPGRWDLDAPDPGLWKTLYWINIYKYTCTKIRLFLSTPIHLNTKCIDILCQRHATSSTASGETRPL